MSKMQMLIFATGIAIVGVLFLGFISGMELRTLGQNTISSSEKVILDRVSSENLCSVKDTLIPDVLYYGIGSSSLFFYDMNFSRVNLTDYNALVISISEHGKKNILASKSIPMKASIVLVDPGFIMEDAPLDNYFDKSEISLYPRAATKGKQAAPPNAFVALKSVENNWSTLYIIPCSSLISSANINAEQCMGNDVKFGCNLGVNNCVRNILKVGCHLLKVSGSSANVSIPQCFDVTREITNAGEQVRGLTWAQCQDLFPGSV
jgi:hypothetical protein